MEYSKFNDPMNYMRVTRELIDMGIPGTAIFAAKSDESINHVKASYCLNGIYMLRTAANVRINSESVLAYEVVRDTPDSYEKIKDKIDR